MLIRKKIRTELINLLKNTLPVRLLYRRLMASSPYLINCELTTRCNLNCQMCSRPKWVGKNNAFKITDMPQEILNKALDGVERMRDRDLIFMTNGLGEPLLYPGLIEVIKEARRRAPKIKFSFTTNAVNLDENTAKKLIETGVDEMTISVNAADRQAYAALMGGDCYDKVVGNIEGLLAMRKKLSSSRPRLNLQFLETKLTQGSKKDFYAFWEPRLGKTDKIFTHEPVNHAGAVETEGLLNKTKNISKYPCSQCWSRIAIRVNGDAYPCDASYYACGRIPELFLGNILEVPLYEMYFGERAKVKKIRDKQLMGDYSTLGPCAVCDTFKLAPNAFFHIPLILKRKWL